MSVVRRAGASIVAALVLLLCMGCSAPVERLMKAIDAGDTNSARRLLDCMPGLANNWTPVIENVGARYPLQEAVITNRYDIAELLMARGARVDQKDHLGKSALHYAAELGRPRLVSLLLRHGAAACEATAMGDSTPLMLAADMDHFDAVIVLASVDKKSIKPIHVATTRGDQAELLTLIHRNRASVNQRDALLKTALHYAAVLDKAATVSVLVKAGANPDLKDRDKMTPLHLAANRGNLRAVEALIQGGADENALNVDYETPLHLAAMHDHPKVVAALLRAGARRAPTDTRGRTPLDLAEYYHVDAVVRLLRARPAARAPH